MSEVLYFNTLFLSLSTEYFFFPMVLQPNVGRGLLILDEVSRTHTMMHHSQ